MNNCFVFETLNDVKQLKKETKNGLMTLSGVFGECGVRNNNNRVYEKSNYGKMVAEMQGRIKAEGAIPGELEHPSTMNVTLENISHKITDINIDENGLVTGTIQLLNTPKGKIAQAIVEGGLPLFVSSRAQGQIGKDGNVTLEKLATFDLVGTPGFSQARMHLNESQVCESLSENIFVIKESTEIDENNIELNDMELKEVMERFEALENRITELENENQALRESNQNIDLKKLADGIQTWIVEEYTAEVEKWITEEFARHSKAEYKKTIVEEVAPLIQKWVVEEFTPEVEKWIIEEFSPEVEKWVVEEYSPEIERWVVEKVAPGIQNWIINEYSTEVESWLNENYIEKVKTKTREQISEQIKESKDSKLKSITETLELLESMDVKKPVYSGRMINENVEAEPLYIKLMPEALRPKYNMASTEVKESIARRAQIFDFSKEGAVERFWERVNFDAQPNVNESLIDLNTIQDRQERAIRAAFRRNRRNY